MATASHRDNGLTLIELLLTIAVLGLLAAVLIPQLSSDLPQRLSAAAQVVASDLDYARGLAVANSSKYRVTFAPQQNCYWLRHSGENHALDTLPSSPLRLHSEAASQQTTELDRLPMPAPAVRLVAVVRMQAGGQATSEIEFTPLGGTTAAYETVVWLACGSGSGERFISVHVNPVTGLTEIGPHTGQLPAAAVAAQSEQAAGL